MLFESEFFYFNQKLNTKYNIEINEINECINSLDWKNSFSLEIDGKDYRNQDAYNRALESKFKEKHWDCQPVLTEKIPFIGDFRKNKVYVEIEFGNSASLFRDYYKFHYGWKFNKIELAVLVVPKDPQQFFPDRSPKSISNMAKFDTARDIIEKLDISIPILLIGLLPKNK
jgi:hypothetical protein